MRKAIKHRSLKPEIDTETVLRRPLIASIITVTKNTKKNITGAPKFL